ncbi:MAG TPA: hypothetical protein VGQ53_17900 [Chitinophagaceae bacterium]|nr:hypothetical protein [Chitinophagaceae bacterium]
MAKLLIFTLQPRIKSECELLSREGWIGQWRVVSGEQRVSAPGGFGESPDYIPTSDY